MQDIKESASLLVALPNGFGFANFFRAKLDRVLSTLNIDSVTVMQDARSIAKEYFDGLDVPISKIDAIPRISLKRKLSSYTHIIVFWDGEDLSDLVFTAKILKKPLRIIPVEITKVRNKDKYEPFDVYIGRGTPWGNPFPIGKGGVGDTREEVIQKYKEYFEQELLTDPERKKALLSLRGYRLACHCKPLACHGDIIASYLNSLDYDDGEADAN
jgi:hypothetical protein